MLSVVLRRVLVVLENLSVPSILSSPKTLSERTLYATVWFGETTTESPAAGIDPALHTVGSYQLPDLREERETADRTICDSSLTRLYKKTDKKKANKNNTGNNGKRIFFI